MTTEILVGKLNSLLMDLELCRTVMYTAKVKPGYSAMANENAKEKLSSGIALIQQSINYLKELE